MKIVLAIEKRKDEPAVEETFTKSLIRFGRDADKCDVAFDNRVFKMVSRHHADIRFSKGVWRVGDMGSSFGTYLNDGRIEKPCEIRTGSTIQFGEGGPCAHVIWLEAGEASKPEEVGKAASPQREVQPRQEVSNTPKFSEKSEQIAPMTFPGASANRESVSKPTEKLFGKLRFEQDPERSAVEIKSEELWLGRDPSCDVAFEESAVMVSRKHACIRRSGSAFLLDDNDSFNGTLVNEQRISSTVPLYDEDRVRLGPGGPVLVVDSSGSKQKPGKAAAGQRSVGANQLPDSKVDMDYSGTMVFSMPSETTGSTDQTENPRQLLVQVGFGDKNVLTVGRDPKCDITLDGLQISSTHARLRRTADKVIVEDVASTNGVFVNGERVSRKVVDVSDTVRIGAFVLEIDAFGNVCVFDTRSKTRIDSVNISKRVKNRAGPGMIQLLDDISLSINPNEFIGLLGPSGAGKSTFMDAINGMRPPTEGTVLINGLDLYAFLDSLKQSIGYVPQDEILHEGLTVEKTLYYIAKLRLSRDVTENEIDKIIDEVLDVTDLAERRGVAIQELSGGQRKRVSIAVELITKPSVIYLDEPTSGLDPATEEKIMLLFRQIAESGRTVILTTHAMENVKLFDKIVLLMRGKLVFYGKPEEALSHFGASSFKDLYDKLEEPVEEELQNSGDGHRFEVTDRVAANWRNKFQKTKQYRENIQEPLVEISTREFSRTAKRSRLGIFGSIKQWLTLTSRYSRVLLKDKFNLFILFAQAPVIAVLVFFVMGSDQPRDFAYFALSLCAIWFGTSVAAREIVRERKIYERERMVNLGILPYLGSKYTVLGLIVAVQCLLLFIPLKFFDITGLMPMPGFLAGIPQFIAMLLTAAVGITLGVFVSAIVKTSETATSLIPLILIPQIIFSGLIGLPSGINKVVGLSMPAAWSFDTMKRFSTLDTLDEEGALPNGETDGKGLYKSVEDENDKIITDAKQSIRDYERELEKRMDDADRRARNGEGVTFPKLPDRPKIGKAKRIPEDLSPYITFLHPWMHEFLNPLVLMLMAFTLFVGTVLVLKLQDFI
ncbi:MAG: FHA domain-containing protein [Pyrinomonadaceae bacterium]|nr:FHA domain-containing protein [Pyrinomonadaceae bacterium]